MSQNPAEWFDGATRVLFVHAHPDDETIATGGTLAALAEAGLEPLIVTLTRGERGEVTPGPFAALAGTENLAPHRMQELAAAITMLGVERHAFLGAEPARAEGRAPYIYEDSGMSWGDDGRAKPADHASDDALTRVPVIEVLNDLLAAAYASGAGAIVSYDDGGGYGHPDHVLAHQTARAVAHALEIPFWEIVSDRDAGTVQQTGTVTHDVTPWLDRKVAALRMYGTQLTVLSDGEIQHVGGQTQDIARTERFRRV